MAATSSALLQASVVRIGQLLQALPHGHGMVGARAADAFARVRSDLDERSGFRAAPIRSTPPRASCRSSVMSNSRYLKLVEPNWPPESSSSVLRDFRHAIRDDGCKFAVHEPLDGLRD